MRAFLWSLLQKLRDVLPVWVNIQNLVFLSVITAFIIIVLWSEKISRYVETIRMSDVNITSTTTILPGTPIPLPAEWVASADQTSGIIIGVVIVLLTVVAGTVGILVRDRKK